MEHNNMLSFIVGAAIGGVAGYMLFKHQDDIVEKLQDLEETLHIDHNALIDKAKNQLDSLTQNVQSTIQRYTHSDEKPSADEIASIMEELARLREEVKALSAT
ncbi:YtxH domain-containing protein [Sulfuricurvum sp.]|mgnify:FL=1|uniref:YtxH domain-containing protein n=1 Tax=Sulfuricurvum sp. TaxID=2025608 RepID=UPI00261821D2|nr:YtxH domain-containing protein [Sulfuricurvum sp.]MDD2837503.1 YtxH domain-containing protein [Sulfuricurvum sp.]MDD3595636.1 YtxH domain-containing protein [Sulfuricurvum sp.]MDD4883758.1 YtxH domain-containing protein [Sulfuricurvum sp.]